MRRLHTSGMEQRLPICAQRCPAPGQNPRILRQRGTGHGFGKQRVPGAHDQHRPILEHWLLRQVADQRFVAQRAQHHVDFAIAQRPRKLGVRSFDHRDVDPRIGPDEARDRVGQPARARQRQGADHDPARRLAAPARQLGEPGAQFGHRQAEAARAALAGGRQRDPAATPVEQPLPQRDRKIGDGPMQRRGGQPGRVGGGGVASGAGDRKEGPKLRARHPRRTDVTDRRFGPGRDQQPWLGRAHSAGAAIEQHDPQRLLKPGDRLGQRGLRQVHRPRGLGDAAVPRGCGERSNMTDVEERFSHPWLLAVSNELIQLRISVEARARSWAQQSLGERRGRYRRPEHRACADRGN